MSNPSIRHGPRGTEEGDAVFRAEFEGVSEHAHRVEPRRPPLPAFQVADSTLAQASVLGKPLLR
jgi:hypothetical protein